MNYVETYYPLVVDSWLGVDDELILVGDFHKRAKAGDFSKDVGNFYPARAGRFCMDHVVIPEIIGTVPIDSTHVIWMK